MKINSRALLLVTAICITYSTKSQSGLSDKQQFAGIGNLKLENGETIVDCQVGYRTFGKLNVNRSNAILFPTWFGGTTNDLEQSVPAKMIDTNHYFLILADALGDGFSSSPSNSSQQPRLSFPKFSIRDMVESQYQLLTKIFHLNHLIAIAGISMGGMQSFQWAVDHPEFADKIIPIVGSPQLSTNDLLLWSGELRSLESDTAFHGGNYSGLPPIPSVMVMHKLAVSTPEYISNTVKRSDFSEWFQKTLVPLGFDWNNWHRQLEAMIGHDIAKSENGSLAEAAKKIKAKMLIVVASQDHMVNPIPATKLAHILHAQLLTLRGDCGHLSPGCDLDLLAKTIREFLAGAHPKS